MKNAYECSHFSSRTDQLTGFTTKTILCCPIRDSTGKNIAVLEVQLHLSIPFEFDLGCE